MAKRSRKGMRDAFRKRREEQRKRESGGGPIFRSDISGVTFWNCQNGDHEVDIIPYIAGEEGPLDRDGNPMNPADEDAYVLEIGAHYIDEKGFFVCPRSFDGSKCPICEEHDIARREGADDKVLKKLKPSMRCIYNIIAYDDTGKEEEKGVQVWQVAKWFTETPFRKLAEKGDRQTKKLDNPYIFYMDVDEGRTLGFTKEGKDEQTRFTAHRLIARDYEIDDDLLDEAHCLEDLINVETYERLKGLFYGSSDDDEDEEKETKKSKSRRSRSKKKDDDDDDEKESPKSRRSRGKKKDDDDDDDEKETKKGRRGRNKKKDDDDDDEKETKKSKGRRGRNKKNDDDEDDEKETKKSKGRRGRGKDDDDDEDEEKETKKSKRSRGKKSKKDDDDDNECPKGHDFGKDIDDTPDCEDCPQDIWDACAQKADEE